METLYTTVGLLIFFSLFRNYYNEFFDENYKLIGITIILIYAYVFSLIAYEMQTLENYFKIILAIITIGLFID